MKNRFLTVLILRHAGPRLRKLRLSYPFVAVLVLVLAMLALTSLYAPRLLLQVRSQSVALERLEHENHRLWVERNEFDGALAEVAEQLDTFEAQAGRLAEELGVPALPATAGGAGGGTASAALRQRFWFENEIRGLQSRTAKLDSSFDQLGEAFRERLGQLAATPNMMPVEGWFSHGFGWRKDPMTGDRDFHRGIDIVAPANTEISAPADGVVSRAGRFPQLGRSLDIAHGYGYVTRYAHMNEILVQPGDRVRRGDRIGLVGSTGRSTGPHLHYEVFRDGRRVNPWKYLGRSGR
jgi:murein DD-endopeptidase MepM/ murein hydrolase activator NlpD